MVDFLAEWGNIITFLIGLAALGGFIWRAIQWMNQQQNIKEATRLKIEEEKAKVIKQEIEERARDLKRDQADTAEDVKRDVEAKAAVIKEEIAATARVLKEHTERMNEQVRLAIKEVDEKVMRMLSDLSKRADMTNGNVKMIRSEIADVQDDVQSLWELVENTGASLSSTRGHRTLSDTVLHRRQQQGRTGRRKRTQIQNDSDEQDDTKHNY